MIFGRVRGRIRAAMRTKASRKRGGAPAGAGGGAAASGSSNVSVSGLPMLSMAEEVVRAPENGPRRSRGSRRQGAPRGRSGLSAPRPRRRGGQSGTGPRAERGGCRIRRGLANIRMHAAAVWLAAEHGGYRSVTAPSEGIRNSKSVSFALVTRKSPLLMTSIPISASQTWRSSPETRTSGMASPFGNDKSTR